MQTDRDVNAQQTETDRLCYLLIYLQNNEWVMTSGLWAKRAWFTLPHFWGHVHFTFKTSSSSWTLTLSYRVYLPTDTVGVKAFDRKCHLVEWLIILVTLLGDIYPKLVWCVMNWSFVWVSRPPQLVGILNISAQFKWFYTRTDSFWLFRNSRSVDEMQNTTEEIGQRQDPKL